MSAVTWSTMWRGALNVLAALLGFSEPVINAPEPDGTTHREWPGTPLLWPPAPGFADSTTASLFVGPLR
jgi:hypothetical protein